MNGEFASLAKLVEQLTHVNFRLLGGLAVRMLGEDETWDDDLALIQRPTEDIDIGLLPPATAIPRLTPVMVGARIDVLQYEPVTDGFDVEELQSTLRFRLPDDGRDIRIPGSNSSVTVVGETSLVLMKAASIADPTRSKSGTDLADVAVLAIRERCRPTGLSERLGAWKPRMSDRMLKAVHKLRRAFEDPTGRGPYEFSKVVRSGATLLDQQEWDEQEAHATEQASIAVRSLLRDFIES